MKNIKTIVALLSLFLFCSCHTVVGNWLERHADNHLTYGEKNAHQGLFRVDGAYIAYTKEEMESDTVYGSAGFVFTRMEYVQTWVFILLWIMALLILKRVWVGT